MPLYKFRNCWRRPGRCCGASGGTTGSTPLLRVAAPCPWCGASVGATGSAPRALACFRRIELSFSGNPICIRWSKVSIRGIPISFTWITVLINGNPISMSGNPIPMIWIDISTSGTPISIRFTDVSFRWKGERVWHEILVGPRCLQNHLLFGACEKTVKILPNQKTIKCQKHKKCVHCCKSGNQISAKSLIFRTPNTLRGRPNKETHHKCRKGILV